jgi:hypothetical protein
MPREDLAFWNDESSHVEIYQYRQLKQLPRFCPPEMHLTELNTISLNSSNPIVALRLNEQAD